MPRYTIRIEQDIDAESPRDWDNLGVMICDGGRRHSLGDKHDLNLHDFNDWDDVERHLRERCDAIEVLPVYIYDHGGIALSTEPFGCRWDSWQCGVIYTTRNRVHQYGETSVPLSEILKAEVDVYSRYVNGETYYWRIDDRAGEIVEIVGGYYDESEARVAAEAHLQWLIEHAPRPCRQLTLTCQGRP